MTSTNSIKRRLPTTEQLRAAARKGLLIDRVEEYLPDSLYRRPKASSVVRTGASGGSGRNGRAPNGPPVERGATKKAQPAVGRR